uniref:Uncharacterized protein n=1 Tax=Lactuca sativa TaxID=4236 RepID=A0A9R1VPE1_LACSA|nr:hypothetical protein LSAT_V11C400204680 [Lactuca sativa]
MPNITTEAVIEKILEIQCNKRLQDTCQILRLDYVVLVKGSGPHDIQYDYQQDRPPKEIIVSCKCAEAVYIPCILACSAHVEKGDLVAVSVVVEQPSRNNGWAIGITHGIVLQGLKTDVMKGDIFLQNLPSIITAHVLEIHNLAAELGLTSIKAYKLYVACSALGLRPRLFAGEDTVESLRRHGKYQKRLFDQAVQLDPRIGGPGLVGHCELSNGYFGEWLRAGEEDLV